jgi:hypothetical protein
MSIAKSMICTPGGSKHNERVQENYKPGSTSES